MGGFEPMIATAALVGDGDLVLRNGTGMERGGEENTARASSGGLFNIADITYSAGGEDGAVACQSNDRPQPVEVRSCSGAHAAKVDSADPVRPERWVREQGSLTAQALAFKVKRENDAPAETCMDVFPGPERGKAFACDHQGGAERQPERIIGDVGKTGID